LTALKSSVAVVTTHSPATPLPGMPITYTLIVTNDGAEAITSVTITDTLPMGVTFSGQTSSMALMYTNPAGSLHVWEGALTLNPGESVTVTIDAVADVCYTGSVDNTGWAAVRDGCGVIMAETANLDSFSLTSPASPNLVLTMNFTTRESGFTTSTPAPEAGSVIRYTVTVENKPGAQTAYDVQIVDTLPTSTTTIDFNTLAMTGTGVWMSRIETGTGGQVVLTLSKTGGSTMAPGESVTVVVDATINSTGIGEAFTVHNTAYATYINMCNGARLESALSRVAIDIASPVSEPDAGTVKIVAGVRGYLDPRSPATQGRHTTVLVKATGAGEIRMRIYNQRGVLIREVTTSTSGGNMETLFWDGKDASGVTVAPGIYPVLIEGPGIRARDKIAVIR